MKGSKRRKPSVYLFLNTGKSDLSIVNEHNEAVSLADAKKAWESGNLSDYNLAFRRLAMMNWDYEAVKAYYAKGGRP